MVVVGILVVAALAWGYTVYLAYDMDGMDMGSGMSMGMAMPNIGSWTVVDWGSMFLMWAVMMTAMMVPTAAPMILIFASVNRKRQEQLRPFVPTGGVSFGVRTGLVWICGERDRSQLGAAHQRPTRHDDGGEHQCLPRRLAPAGCRSVSVEPAKVCLLEPLPVPPFVPHDRLEGGQVGRPENGSASWHLLRRMLLDFDGAALRAGDNEPGLDRSFGWIRFTGKGNPTGREGQQGGWHWANGLGLPHGRRGDWLTSSSMIPNSNW